MNLQELKEQYAKNLGYQSFEHLVYMSEPQIINEHVICLMEKAVSKYVGGNVKHNEEPEEEFKFQGSSEQWWFSYSEIMTGIHGKVGKVYGISMHDNTPTEANKRVIINSVPMFEKLKEVYSYLKKDEFCFNEHQTIKKGVYKLLKEVTRLKIDN